MGKGLLDLLLGKLCLLMMITGNALFGNSMAFGRAKEEARIFITSEVSNKNPYEGESIVLTYKLYSPLADIRYARRAEEPVILDDEKGVVSAIETDSRGYREQVKGINYYVFPLESYIIAPESKGSYSLNGGSFDIGIDRMVTYEDPFWGYRRGYKTERVHLSVPELSIKVKGLPSSKSKNGERAIAVGSFTVNTVVPPGDIILERPARAIITLKGQGLLSQEVLPQYAEAFQGGDLRLKSMSENRKTYFDGKSVVSEVILDCEFIPLSKTVKIGEVKFSFFNPVNGKYEEVRSNPVEVNVKSITSSVKTVDI